MSLLATPVESEERREEAASGSPFLWTLSFGDAKESVSPVGARTDLENIRRDSDTAIVAGLFEKHRPQRLQNPLIRQIPKHPSLRRRDLHPPHKQILHPAEMPTIFVARQTLP